MKKEKVKFIAGVNNLFNVAGNSVREIENLLVSEKSTKADVLELVNEAHINLYNLGTDLGLVFDEGSAVVQTRTCKSCP